MKASTHSRTALPSSIRRKSVASSRKSTVMGRFARVGLAAVPMCHPSVIRSRQLRRPDVGHTLTSQDHHEWLGTLPLNPMECGHSSDCASGHVCSSGLRSPCILRPVIRVCRGTLKPLRSALPSMLSGLSTGATPSSRPSDTAAGRNVPDARDDDRTHGVVLDAASTRGLWPLVGCAGGITDSGFGPQSRNTLPSGAP
jgi:hypothetical protein